MKRNITENPAARSALRIGGNGVTAALCHVATLQRAAKNQIEQLVDEVAIQRHPADQQAMKYRPP